MVSSRKILSKQTKSLLGGSYIAAILQILKNYKENFREVVDCLKKILQTFSRRILLKRVSHGSFPLHMHNFKAAFF